MPSVNDLDSDTYELTFESAFFGGVYVGTFLGSGFRGELAVDAMHFELASANDETGDFDIVSGGTDAVALTASLWRDLPGIGVVTPYVGLGAGIAWTSNDFILEALSVTEGFQGDDLSAVGLVGAGARVDLSDRLTLDLGYRFLSIINARNEQGPPTPGSPDYGQGNFTTHLFSAGLSYRFGERQGEGEGDHPTDLYAPIYIGGFFGSAWTPDAHLGVDNSEEAKTVFDDPHASFGAIIGAEVAPHLRGELELSFVRSEPSYLAETPPLPYSGRFDQTFVLANLWQDFGEGPLTAYAGGGLGFALVDYDITGYSSNEYDYDGSLGVFAGQFGAGLRYQATSNLTFDIGYRLRGAFGAVLTDAQSNGPSLLDNSRITLYSQTLQVGASYAFGAMPNGEMYPNADNGSYVSLAGGIGLNPVGEMFEDSAHPIFFHPAFGLSVAYGQQITDYLRAEVELGFSHMQGDELRNNDVNDPLEPLDGSATQISVMTNYWADFDLGYVQPYVGGGVGMAMVQADYQFNTSIYGDEFSPALALQVGAGVRKPVGDNFLLDLGYRYRSTIDAFADETGIIDPGTVTYETHGVHMGLTWLLGQ